MSAPFPADTWNPAHVRTGRQTPLDLSRICQELRRFAREEDERIRQKLQRIAGEKEHAENQREQLRVQATREQEEMRLAAEKLLQEQRLAAEKELEESRLAAEIKREQLRVQAAREEEERRLAAERELQEQRLAAEKEKECMRLQQEKELQQELLAAEKEKQDRAIEAERELKMLEISVREKEVNLEAAKFQKQFCLEALEVLLRNCSVAPGDASGQMQLMQQAVVLSTQLTQKAVTLPNTGHLASDRLLDVSTDAFRQAAPRGALVSDVEDLLEPHGWTTVSRGEE